MVMEREGAIMVMECEGGHHGDGVREGATMVMECVRGPPW